MAREFEVAKEVRLPAGPERVWDAVATGPGIDSWFMGKHEVDAEARKIRFAMGDFGSEAEITAWEPPRRFAYRSAPAEDGGFDAFEYLIEAADGGASVLRFIHHSFTNGDWGDEYHESFSIGWDMYLHTLAEYLAHFPGGSAEYVLADGPAASADAAAWPKLLDALGLPAEPVLGQPVRFTVDGLPPIEGVLDYTTPQYVGIRTPDALLRFHGRWPMGMTIAAGHHLFSGSVDPAQQSKAWQAWLEQVLGTG
ncbi:SRPBCC family protein [Amycolatopsis sp. NBC_01480]|uniref:SRPBCC family protein n=1 Tax=Amycolatopsis sp. NBC_01480 TaxID=2903562 RepID=UPI002E2D64EB|nr:SRPBCC domain-containing protein [Amycolatopsis sp. NBC_01480]